MTQDIASMQSGIAACVNKGLLLLAGAALAWSCLSNAAQAVQPPSPAHNVRANSSPLDLLQQRLVALSESELKQVYVQCSHQALQRRLDGGEASFCSTAYDVLLKTHFSGDFAALLAWSRQQRDQPIESSAGATAPRQTQQRALRRIDWY
jgi:hypothetical protein